MSATPTPSDAQLVEWLRLAEAATPNVVYDGPDYGAHIVFGPDGDGLASFNGNAMVDDEANAKFYVSARVGFPACIVALMECRKELALWRPLTPAEAKAELDAAVAVPLSEERINEIVRRAVDPAGATTNSEQAQLAVALQEARRELAAVREALQCAVDYHTILNDEFAAKYPNVPAGHCAWLPVARAALAKPGAADG